MHTHTSAVYVQTFRRIIPSHAPAHRFFAPEALAGMNAAVDASLPHKLQQTERYAIEVVGYTLDYIKPYSICHKRGVFIRICIAYVRTHRSTFMRGVAEVEPFLDLPRLTQVIYPR